MRYKVNTSCAECGRRYSYWSDDPPSAKRCQFTVTLRVDGVDHVRHFGPCETLTIPDV